MDDRELLKLAAKASRIIGYWVSGVSVVNGSYNGNTEGIYTQLETGRYGVWNPLTDDGDALRLAVSLGVTIYTKICTIFVSLDDYTEITIAEDRKGDPYVATRRAIVRAAAEIGRAI